MFRSSPLPFPLPAQEKECRHAPKRGWNDDVLRVEYRLTAPLLHRVSSLNCSLDGQYIVAATRKRKAIHAFAIPGESSYLALWNVHSTEREVLLDSEMFAGDRKVFLDPVAVSKGGRLIAVHLKTNNEHVVDIWNLDKEVKEVRLGTDDPPVAEHAPISRSELTTKLEILRSFELPAGFFSDDLRWLCNVTEPEGGRAWDISDPAAQPMSWTVHMPQEEIRVDVPVEPDAEELGIDFWIQTALNSYSFSTSSNGEWHALHAGGWLGMARLFPRYPAAAHVVIWRKGDDRPHAFVRTRHEGARLHFLDSHRLCVYDRKHLRIFDVSTSQELARITPRWGFFDSILRLPGDTYRWALADRNEIAIVHYDPPEA